MLTSQRQGLEGVAHPLKASDVHVSYVKGDEVLKGVDLVLHTGELILVRGVSGSGKTTLLNVLSGLLSPLRGTVCINGVDITKISESRRDAIRLHEMGMVFQHHGLVPDFTSRENIELVLLAREIKNSAAIAMDALKEVGVAELADRRPAEMSGGQAQRVGIARAIAGGHRIVLADEPTGQLDRANTDMIFKVLRHIVTDGADRAVLLSSHDPRACDYVDRVLDMEDGVLEEV